MIELRLVALAIASLPLFIWIYLVFFRGFFWRVSTHLPPQPLPQAEGKRVCVLIPARDEAPVIGRTIAALLTQEYAGSLHVFLVDDNSRDGTAEAAGRAENLTIIPGRPLPPGWNGKVWALSQALPAAYELNPDYLLFTDADIVHSRQNVAKLVALAEHRRADLTSLMVKLHCSSFAEKALLPAFVFFFFKLYPPRWIQSPRRRTAGAAGGCVLIRPQALQAIGGLDAIRSEVIDDCSLARAIKQNGGRVWLGLTNDAMSSRCYGSFREIGRMVSRTAFNQLRHSSLALLITTLGLFLTYLLPIALLFTGSLRASLLGFTAWLLMSLAYLPMVLFYRQSFLWMFALPPVAAFYTGVTIHSAIQYWKGEGGIWKGRVQDARR